MTRNIGLDILRTISICCVLLQHCGIAIPFFYRPGIGGLGVEVFFVLSGFLIGDILLRQLQKENSFKSIKTFWFRRWFRILPAYFFVLSFKFIFIDHTIGANIIYYYLFLQNNIYGTEFYPETWSLVIEEWFYMMLPLFLYFFIKLKGLTLKKGMLYFILFIILEIILRFVFVTVKSNAGYPVINSNFLLRFDSFMMGVILAYLKSYYLYIFEKLNKTWLFLVAIILLIIYLVKINSHTVSFDESTFLKIFHHPTVSFLIALTIPFFYFINLSNINFQLQKIIKYIFTNISKLTYSLYLIHPFFYWIFDNNHNFLSILLFFCCTFCSAIGLYFIIEKPFLKLRDNLIKQ